MNFSYLVYVMQTKNFRADELMEFYKVRALMKIYLLFLISSPSSRCIVVNQDFELNYWRILVLFFES